MPSTEAEPARARLLAIAPGGFEERAVGDLVELSVYGSGKTEERIRAAFDDVRAARVEPGWEDTWRAFHRSVRVGGLWLGPSWERPPDDAAAVVVDPGRAFGTGAHPTTRLCIELLARSERGSILDAGCGSGVLAVAAARLGFRPVLARDVDETAVEVAQQTARRNGVDVDARAADVLHDELPRVDMLVANIELRAVEALLARRPAGRAITSGYLTGERPRSPGWAHVDCGQLDGWTADRFAAL